MPSLRSSLARATHGFVSILPVALGFTTRRDVLRSGFLQYLLGFFDPLGVVAVHGEKESSFFDPAFVTLGFEFWNTHTNQGSRNAADHSTRAGARERSHDRTSGDQRTDSRNCERANSSQPSQATADNGTRSRSGGGSLRRFSVLHVGEILGALVLGKKNGDVSVAKVFLPQPVDCVLHTDS